MILRIFFRPWLAAFILTGSMTSAHATTDAAAIRDAVQAFMENHVATLQSSGASRVEFTITALDNRLAFPDCPAPLQIDQEGQPGNSSRLMLKVGCNQGAIWSIYVPVALNTYRNVVVASQPLQRGSTLTASQLQLKEIDVAQLHSQYFTTLEAVAGKQVRRPVRDGAVISADAIEEPIAIRRGDNITIIANSGGLTVKMQGTALGDGRIGEQISVRNQSSERVIKAIVQGKGEVQAVM